MHHLSSTWHAATAAASVCRFIRHGYFHRLHRLGQRQLRHIGRLKRRLEGGFESVHSMRPIVGLLVAHRGGQRGGELGTHVAFQRSGWPGRYRSTACGGCTATPRRYRRYRITMSSRKKLAKYENKRLLHANMTSGKPGVKLFQDDHPHSNVES